jgi:hypothetical protein
MGDSAMSTGPWKPEISSYWVKQDESHTIHAKKEHCHAIKHHFRARPMAKRAKNHMTQTTEIETKTSKPSSNDELLEKPKQFPFSTKRIASSALFLTRR